MMRSALAAFLPKVVADPAKPKKKRAKLQTSAPQPAPPAEVVELALASAGAPRGQRVICDYPPNALNPNRTGPLRIKIKAKKNYRNDCFVLAKAAKLHAPADGDIRVRLDIFYPGNAKRDDDNAEASFKAGRDAIAAAMGIDDSRFRITRTVHRQRLGCMVFTIIDGAAE